MFEIEGAKDIFKGQDYYNGAEPDYQEDTNTYMFGSFYEQDEDEDEDGDDADGYDWSTHRDDWSTGI
jgi:hypothetical protein